MLCLYHQAECYGIWPWEYYLFTKMNLEKTTKDIQKVLTVKPKQSYTLLYLLLSMD